MAITGVAAALWASPAEADGQQVDVPVASTRMPAPQPQEQQQQTAGEGAVAGGEASSPPPPPEDSGVSKVPLASEELTSEAKKFREVRGPSGCPKSV